MKWRKKVEDAAEAIREERRDDQRLREALAIRQHDIERRLALLRSQSTVLRRKT